MKCLVLSLLALAALATETTETTTPTETTETTTPTTTEPNADLGETKCTSVNGAFTVCPWTHECHESSNATWNFCIPKGNKVCYTYQFLGEEGVIVAAAAHHPSTSCCESASCTSRQTCIEIHSGSDTFTYDFKTYAADDAARNDWKNAKGEAFKHKPKKCINTVFDATQGTRQVVAPATSMMAIVIAFLLMLLKSKLSRLGMLLPLIVLLASFFLCLSECWVFALFTAFVTVAATSTPEGHQGRLLLFLVAFAWLYFGGMNLFFAYTTADTPTNYFLKAHTTSLTGLEASCNAYFDSYFSLNAGTKAWWTDTTYTTGGLCGRSFVSFLIIMAYLQAAAFFLMVALKALFFLSPEAAASSKLGRCLGRLPCFKSTVAPAKEAALA